MDYSKIKVIGFDLDQTLYPKSPEIDSAIQGYIYKKIADHKNCELEEAKKLFDDLYKRGSGLSGKKTLMSLGIPNASEIVQEALERAEIDKFLVPDESVINLLKEIKNRYGYIDLLTGSNKEVSIKKLNKLKISPDIFNCFISDDIASKSSGDAYRMWLDCYKQSNFIPEEFLYIGDRGLDYEYSQKFGINCILVNIKNKNDLLNCLQLESLLDLKNIVLGTNIWRFR